MAALKQLILTRQIQDLERQRQALETAGKDIKARRSAFDERAAKAAKALEDITAETTDEERSAYDAEIQELEGIETQLRADEEKSAADIAAIDQQLTDKRSELDAINEAAKTAASGTAGGKEENGMNNERNQHFPESRVDNLLQDENVRTWLGNVRKAGIERRAIKGADLYIPESVLGTIRTQIGEYSKLMKHVYTVRIGGNGREIVAGDAPEAVWTEACGSINEVAFNIYDVEVNAYKVGGFVPVCNASLRDSDGQLLDLIMDMLARAIGYALDKAILYGKGVKMPMGIMTRLAQTMQPEGYSPTAEPWVDLHTSNLLNVPKGNLGGDLIANIIKASGAAIAHGVSEKFWVMNEKTKTNLIAASIGVNAAGAIVAGMNNTFPAIGGVIETLDFIPDDNIIMGYGNKYLLAERQGTEIAYSAHVKFVEDQTLYKGTARYDGAPVIASAFVGMGIGKAPTATMEFASDTANAG